MDTNKEKIVKRYNTLKECLGILAQAYSEQADEEKSDGAAIYYLAKSLAYKECIMFLDYSMGDVL